MRLNELSCTHNEWALMQAVLSKGGLLHDDLKLKRGLSAFARKKHFSTWVLFSVPLCSDSCSAKEEMDINKTETTIVLNHII